MARAQNMYRNRNAIFTMTFFVSLLVDNMKMPKCVFVC